MARYLDDGEVQIDNSTQVHFRNAFQQLIMIAALNVGTLLGARIKAKCFFLKTQTTLLISGCTQVNDQFYSKKNFTSESFRADASECKRQNPSFVAIQSTSRTVEIAHRISTMQWSATA